MISEDKLTAACALIGATILLSRLEPLANAGGSLTPPLSQMRRVRAFAPQQRTDTAVLGGRVRLDQDLLLVLGREPPAFRFGHHFWTGWTTVPASRRRRRLDFVRSRFARPVYVQRTPKPKKTAMELNSALGFSFRPEH